MNLCIILSIVGQWHHFLSVCFGMEVLTEAQDEVLLKSSLYWLVPLVVVIHCHSQMTLFTLLTLSVRRRT